MATRAYIHLAEHPAGPDVIAANDFEDQLEILVGDVHDGDEEISTVTVTWYKLGGRLRPRVEIFDEEWSAFETASDVFDALGQRQGSAICPAEFCAMLDRLGYQNITDTGEGA